MACWKSPSHTVLNSLQVIILNTLINIVWGLDRFNYSDNTGTFIEDTIRSLKVWVSTFGISILSWKVISCHVLNLHYHHFQININSIFEIIVKKLYWKSALRNFVVPTRSGYHITVIYNYFITILKTIKFEIYFITHICIHKHRNSCNC